jgi:DNA-binding HxlR family transcriptional regulator
MSERDVVLLFVDALNRAAGEATPILISDLRAQLLEASRRNFDVNELDRSSPTMLFHLLRQLVEDGLVDRNYTGYVLTQDGRASAAALRARDVQDVEALEQAARSALERVA